MNPHDPNFSLRETIERARADLEAAQRSFVEIGGSILLAENSYDASPSDESFQKIENLKALERRRERDVDRAARLLASGEEAFAANVRADQQEELGRLQLELDPRHRSNVYGPSMEAILERLKETERLIAGLDEAQRAFQQKHARAAHLARELGVVGFHVRFPRPDVEEGILLLRIRVAKQTEGRAHESLAPWDEPDWRAGDRDRYLNISATIKGDNR